jgi:Fe-S cluster biogenesis protein NfuA/nitrite reductase/ring-hydroxylating ferredoxin subunit
VEFDQAVAELGTLVETLERDGDARALMLLELVDAIHRPALELILAGRPDDPIAQAVLSMYELAPVDDQIQVEEALDEIRPYVESHGGEVKLLSVEDGVVHIEMSGSCQGCAGSAITLRRGIEERLRERYPGFREVVAHDPAGGADSQLLQLETPQLLQIEGLRRPRFESVALMDELTEGEVRAAELDGVSVLVVKVAGEPFAFKNACPQEPERHLALDGGRLAGNVLVCPWHNCAYDARTGRRVDDRPGEPGLSVVPVALEAGMVKVAVNVV